MGVVSPNGSNHPPSCAVDIILMDDNMPNLSGPEATAAIRAAGYTGLIFGVTGNTFDDQIKDFTSKGADMVFAKPLNMRELQEAIQLKLPAVV
jgi:CheY-like chemotaxis protein